MSALMRAGMVVLLLESCLALADVPTVAVETHFKDDHARLFLATDMPKLSVAEIPLTEAETQQANTLIRELAETDAPMTNVSGFLPVRVTEEYQGGIVGAGPVERSDPLTKLVELGPRVLPLLLKALENATPTKLTIKHGGLAEGMIGGMHFAREMRGNPLSRIESEVLGEQVQFVWGGGGWQEDAGDSYTLTVGDFCFVAIGQIVGRSYEALRYQPTMVYVLNSPTRDPTLLEQTRNIWSGEKPMNRVLESLLMDYSTRATSHFLKRESKFYGTWAGALASSFQCTAATRLMYYFPEHAGPLISRRLRELDLGVGITGSEEWRTREEKNKVDTHRLIQAVSWTKDTTVAAEIERILRTSDDPGILLACVEDADRDNPKLFLSRFQSYVRRLPSLPFDPDAYDYKLLRRIIRELGKETEPLLAQFRRRACHRRRVALCVALRDEPFAHAARILRPLLDEKRFDAKSFVRAEWRVCDWAADVIHRRRPEFAFDPEGDRQTRDRQISMMKLKLDYESFGAAPLGPARTSSTKPAD